MTKQESSTGMSRRVAVLSTASVGMLWMAQPPLMLWPLAMFALVPLMRLIRGDRLSKKSYLVLWAITSLYWLVSLQGLRHAHPLMFLPLIALAAYLAVYQVLFVAVVRDLIRRRIPLVWAVPVAWVGQECIRNYLLSGISALMLGHTLADVPIMIQIADVFGSYGVSFLVASVNVAAYFSIEAVRGRDETKQWRFSAAFATLIVLATLLYGSYRMREPLGSPTATIALIQRTEPIEFIQSRDRAIEIFRNYVHQSIESLRAYPSPVDAVVWPESMFTGGLPWQIANSDARVPDDAGMTATELRQFVSENCDYFLERAGNVQQSIAAVNDLKRPHLIAGCGVIQYREVAHMYSGAIHLDPTGELLDWYGKTHRVMVGEYIPLVPEIPGLRNLIPEGFGLTVGPGPKTFRIGTTTVSPNVCIETAVERVTVNQVAELAQRGESPEMVINVTNDGWFDDSSVVDHHLRCAQLVAVGCRRPVLSAANNGPTAWIDSRGVIVDQLPRGVHGAILARPQPDERTSAYTQIGDWPARVCILFCVIVLVTSRFGRQESPSSSVAD